MTQTKEIAAETKVTGYEVMIEHFRKIVGNENILLSEKEREEYGHDKTEDYQFMPDLVIKPGSAKEVSEVIKICNENRIPVTPRGAGTGLSGGALPINKGAVISMERFNRILEIDELNFAGGNRRAGSHHRSVSK